MPIQGFTALEQEIIVLKAAWDSIHDMVNFEMFAKPERLRDMNFVFRSMTRRAKK